jgi:L-tartrate/succinate antiporter
MAITVTHDHVPPIETPRPAVTLRPPHAPWKALAPIVLALLLALIPPPGGLAPHAWYFFAIFAGVILGLMLEPLPGGAIGLIGVTVVAVLSQWVLFAPAELAKPGFKAYNAALT